MPKKKSAFEIPCVSHPVKVKILSLKRLNSIIHKNKGEPNALAGYVSKDNTIYIAREQAPSEFMHTLWHELKHVFDEQVEDVIMRAEAANPDEAAADAFASFMLNLFPHIKSIEGLLNGRK